MTQKNSPKINKLKLFFIFALTLIMLIQTSCATFNSLNKKVFIGMLAGAAGGALISNQFRSENQQEKTRNAIMYSLVFALIVGGALVWHYQEIEQVKVDTSGRYARYRLCDPDEMQNEILGKLEVGKKAANLIYRIPKTQIGKFAIFLDDNTKWTYPSFRKRYLQPERGEMQVISARYIWEIIKPGSFVTRSQNPEYFAETEAKKKNKNK